VVDLRLAFIERLPEYPRMTKPLIDVVQIGKRGEVVLPRRVRQGLNLQEGDELVVTVEERRLVLERRARSLGTYLDALSSNGSRED
jgi:AbrB family looped-hinge helix DNA binding protein